MLRAQSWKSWSTRCVKPENENECGFLTSVRAHLASVPGSLLGSASKCCKRRKRESRSRSNRSALSIAEYGNLVRQ